MSTEKNIKSRRGHGEGSIYQRQDGYWLGRITIGRDAFGKQLRKTFSGKTQKNVLDKMKQFEKDHYGRDIPQANHVTLKDWIEQWLRNYKKDTVRQTTYELYESLFQKHIKGSSLGKISLQKLKTEQIQEFLRQQKDTGGIPRGKNTGTSSPISLSVSTVNSLHHVIQSALEQARKNRIIVHNVARDCQKFRSDRKAREALTQDQIAALLVVAKEHRLYPALVLSFYTGLRRGELLALTWKCLSLKDATLRITENLVRVKGGSVFQEPKTKSSIRSLSLHANVVDILAIHKATQLEEQKASKGEYQNLGLIFCQKNGKQIDPNNFKRTFNQWCKKAGLPDSIRFHDLRHTFATYMIHAGIDIKTVQSFTGHADTRTLLDIYAKQVKEAQKEAAGKINIPLPEIG